MTVQRHRGFQAQDLSRAPKTTIHHVVLIEIVQHLDDGFGGGAGGDDFEAIFPGVARPGDKQRVLLVFNETASVSSFLPNAATGPSFVSLRLDLARNTLVEPMVSSK